MNKILLTSSTFVRTQTNVSDNLSDKYLMPAIREAQDIYFREIVGTSLLNKLCELVESGDIDEDANAVYKDLVDTAQYYLAYQTASLLVVNTTYKINNIGLNTTTDENVQIPSTSDVFKLKDYYQFKADHYCLLLQHFLINNEKHLKELDNCTCANIKAHLYSSASSNLNLGGRRGKIIDGCKCSKG